MKANMKGLAVIMVLTVLSGVSAHAVIATPGEASSRMNSHETLANLANYFRNTFARPSLLKLTSPDSVTEPKTSQVDLTSLSDRDLAVRVAVLNNFPIGDSFKHVSSHDILTGDAVLIHTKLGLGQKLNPEEKKLLIEILKN